MAAELFCCTQAYAGMVLVLGGLVEKVFSDR